MKKFLKHIKINYNFEIKESYTIAVESNTKIDIATTTTTTTTTIESNVLDTFTNIKFEIKVTNTIEFHIEN